MHYYMLMKQDNKTRTYMFIGIPGSGKTNVLFNKHESCKLRTYHAQKFSDEEYCIIFPEA